MKTAPLKIAVTSLKPHAGRTTSVLSLAWWFGQQGKRVVVLDMNQYRDLLPGKSETGSSKLWKNVTIGAREEGVGDADLVLIDAPPLSAKGSERLLGAVDGVVISVFPIAQNRRFLPASKTVLERLDTNRVFGWFMARINEENTFHRELVEGLRTEFAHLQQHHWIPEDHSLALWNPLAGEDVPEGALRDAYGNLGQELDAWLSTLRSESDAPAKEALHAEAPPAARIAMDDDETAADEPARSVVEKASTQERGAKKSSPRESSKDDSSKTSAPTREASPTPRSDSKERKGISAERRVATNDRRAGRSGTGRRSLDAVPQPFPSAKTPDVAPRPALANTGGWRLADLEHARPRVRLVAAEERLDLPATMRTLPDALPASALRALLRFGLVHGHRDDGEYQLIAKRPALSEKATGPLAEACAALLDEDYEAVLDACKDTDGSADAALLSGLCQLVVGRPEGAAAAFDRAIAAESPLGGDLAALGFGLVVDVPLKNGLSTHFGPNQRGAHFAKAIAHLASGNATAGLAELDVLLELEPDDALVRALRAEQVSLVGSFDELEDLHRTMLVPSYENELDVVLAFLRARTLLRLGVAENASLALREAHAKVPEGWPSLAVAMEREMQLAVETLARIERVRNDLAQAAPEAGAEA